MKLRPALATIAAITIVTGGATVQVRHHGNASSSSIMGHQGSAHVATHGARPLPLPTVSLPPVLLPDGLPTCC
jgi:hypothetical protein